MLYIPRPQHSDLKIFYGNIIGKLKKSITKSTVPQHIKNVLLSYDLRSLLTDEPEKLTPHHSAIMGAIVRSFSDDEYMYYIEIRKNKKLSQSDRKIFNKYNHKVENLKKVFNYDNIISGSKVVSYELAKKLNRNTCTYCNRLYTNTIITVDKSTGRVNDSSRISRPQFDHWFAKSVYPVLSLSYYNLIPSCSVCNSSIKGDDIFSLDTHIHPYIIDNESFSFKYSFDKLNEISVEIDYKGNLKTQKTLQAMRIRDVYNAHSNLEVKDLHDLRYKYSENYIETLIKVFDKLSISKEDIYRFIFGAEYDEVDFYKRPFSKLKKDLLIDMGIDLAWNR